MMLERESASSPTSPAAASKPPPTIRERWCKF
eukprot:COSAG01_NODE_27822_length_676_cov_0.781629_3_plen_31_part_01